MHCFHCRLVICFFQYTWPLRSVKPPGDTREVPSSPTKFIRLRRFSVGRNVPYARLHFLVAVPWIMVPDCVRSGVRITEFIFTRMWFIWRGSNKRIQVWWRTWVPNPPVFQIQRSNNAKCDGIVRSLLWKRSRFSSFVGKYTLPESPDVAACRVCRKSKTQPLTPKKSQERGTPHFQALSSLFLIPSCRCYSLSSYVARNT